MRLKSVILVCLLAIPSMDVAADRLLLPVPITPYELPGSYGSLWRGELYAHNIGPEVAQITTIDHICALITCPAPYREVNVNETSLLFVSSPSMIRVASRSSNAAAEVKFNARIYDESRQMHDWGTEIPLVREHEFSADRLVLNNVPSGDAFRQMVRVYEWEGGGSTDVRIRGFNMLDGALVGEKVITAESVLGFAHDLDFGYVQSYLDEVVPLEIERVRVELSPLNTGKKIWAFVSVTHNETQRATLITPQ